MANIANSFTFSGLTFVGPMEGVPRGITNFEYCPECPPSGGGDTRPAYGQMLPRWNRGGRQQT